MRERLIEAGLSEEAADLVIEIIGGSEESDNLRAEVDRLRREVEGYELKMKNFEIEKELDGILKEAGARNLKAVKGVLNLEEIYKAGNRESIKAMVDRLTEEDDTAFLFEKRKGLRGVRPAGASGKVREKDKKDFKYKDWEEYYGK